MAYRSLIGSLATLTTSVVNLTILMVLKGEPGWICLACCNADILFCVIVLHWVTSKDKPSSYASTHASRSHTIDDTNRATVQSRHTDAKEHSRASKIDTNHSVLESVLERDNTSHMPSWPHDHDAPTSPIQAHLPGSVTTEIRSARAPARSKSRNGRVLQRNRDESSECGDEVELRKIHVQREVCIDSGSSDGGVGYMREGSSASAEGAWGIERTVSAEKMV